MASEKYLGAPSDSGEWWCDRSSEAKDLGPGVSFTVRCGEDGGNGSHLICCYGLREDVRMDRVLAETNRILEEYQKPDKWHRDGQKLQGPLREPTLEKWRSLEDVVSRLPFAWERYKPANVAAGRMVWSIEHCVDSVCGSMVMASRVIELVGPEKIQAMYDSAEMV
jgi:hypothetical protein